jgi:tripartite-type tricarboxylate transporter receptor subunit TctC
MQPGKALNRRHFVKSTTAAAAAMVLPAAHAQSDFPRGPIKVIVGLPPGGAADIVARTIGTEMEKGLKQQVITENKPGGQFVISMQALQAAPADGHTLLYIYNAYSAVHASQRLFDMEKQVIPVTEVAQTPIVIFVRGASPHKSTGDLIDWAKANPGKLNFASLGVGTFEHLLWMRIEAAGGFKGNAVQFRGGPDSIQALIAGDIDCMVGPGLFAKMYAAKQEVRPLAVLGATRWPDLPDIPTAAEVGLKVPPVTYYGGYVVKAGTPPEIVQRLFREISTAAAAPAVAQRHAATGAAVSISKSPEEFRSQLGAEIAWMSELGKGLNLGK